MQDKVGQFESKKMFGALQPSTPQLHFTVHQYIYLHKLHRRGNQEHAQLDRDARIFTNIPA
jgi:hypothetical protein